MLEIKDLHVNFGEKTVLDGFDAVVRPGEIVALIGANGSGKTTLFRAAAGAVKPTSGSILVDGKPQIVGRKPVPVSYVSDRRVVWQSWTPRSVMHRFATIHGIPKKEAEARIADIVERLRMQDYIDGNQAKLSTGQAAKFAIARMMLHPYSCVLLDEPSAGLDFNAAALVRRQLRELADAGHAVFLATHSIEEIVNVADRGLILRDGRIVLGADAAELKERRDELPSLIGEPA